MATTFSNKVGRTRIRLAKLLNEYFPDYHFDPEDLNSQIPIYASALWGCCSWMGLGRSKKGKLSIGVNSWDTMTEVCRLGIDASDRDGRDGMDIEIHAKRPQPGPASGAGVSIDKSCV